MKAQFVFDEELSAILRMIYIAPAHMKPDLVRAAIAHMQKREKESHEATTPDAGERKE